VVIGGLVVIGPATCPAALGQGFSKLVREVLTVGALETRGIVGRFLTESAEAEEHTMFPAPGAVTAIRMARLTAHPAGGRPVPSNIEQVIGGGV